MGSLVLVVDDLADNRLLVRTVLGDPASRGESVKDLPLRCSARMSHTRYPIENPTARAITLAKTIPNTAHIPSTWFLSRTVSHSHEDEHSERGSERSST